MQQFFGKMHMWITSVGINLYGICDHAFTETWGCLCGKSCDSSSSIGGDQKLCYKPGHYVLHVWSKTFCCIKMAAKSHTFAILAVVAFLVSPLLNKSLVIVKLVLD